MNCFMNNSNLYEQLRILLSEGENVIGLPKHEVVDKLLRNMYYDTAISASPYALKAMQELVGSSQIVFGSDLPFAEKVAPIVARDLNNYKGFTKEDVDAILYKNCLDLFPLFKNAASE